MSNPTDVRPSVSLAGHPETQTSSRLLWWLHPKVALPLLFFGMLLAAPFLYRGYRIARVPDIGDPFDVKAFGTVEIAPADNAMTQYALAGKLLRGMTSYSSDDEEKAYEHGWTQTSEPLQKWLDDNEPALAEWRKGTELSQAFVVQPKDFRIDTTLEVLKEAREFTRLARLQAERCAHDGDLEAAWGWLKAIVRASRHVEQNGCLIQRLLGISMLTTASNGIQRWSAHPEVTPELLRTALADVLEADQMTPPNSVTMKTEYIILRNTLNDAKTLQDMLGDGISVPWDLRPPMLFVRGEPEVSLRVFQHVFTNILVEFDKPIRDRAPSVGGSLQLYDLPPGVSASMLASELDKVAQSAVLAGFTLPGYQQIDIEMQREAVRRTAVALLLACQLHFRLHGDWPSKVEDLVPDILTEPPADPLGKSGELMRLKWDGDDLVIYSVGLNGVDDGGNIGDSGATDPNNLPDQGARLERPTKREKGEKQEATPQEKP